MDQDLASAVVGKQRVAEDRDRLSAKAHTSGAAAEPER